MWAKRIEEVLESVVIELVHRREQSPDLTAC
jgi:hypothetical protein